MSKMRDACFFAVLFLLAVSFPDASRAEGGKHLFLLSGQSNMRQPLPDAFEKAVSKVFGKDNIIVITVAQPSQPIRRWYKDWAPPEGVEVEKKGAYGDLYDQLVKKAKASLKEAQPASVTYIWMQGEADAGSGWGAVYEKSFYGILDQFKKDLGIKDINFVVGRINDNWLAANGTKDGELVRSIQQKLGEDNKNGDWVDTDDLNRGVNPWGGYELEGGHFPNPAYRVLGQRFARKASKLIDPDMKLDDSVFDAVFFDSTDLIQSHIAIGKSITGTKPDDGYKKGVPGLTVLVDGEFGTSDLSAKEWVGYSAKHQDAELLIDLGQTQNLTGVGVSMLIDKKAEAVFPEGAAISISEDGKEYSYVGGRKRKAIWFFYKEQQRQQALNTIGTQPILAYIEFGEKSARYIKIEIEKGDARLLLDEIIVNPVAKSE